MAEISTLVPLEFIAEHLAQQQHSEISDSAANAALERVNATPGSFSPSYAVRVLAEHEHQRNINVLVAAGIVTLYSPITYAPTTEKKGALVDKAEVVGKILSGAHMPFLNKTESKAEKLIDKRGKEILRILVEVLKYDPLKLPQPIKNGASGVQAEVRKHLKVGSGLFPNKDAEEKAWAQLRCLKQIKYAD